MTKAGDNGFCEAVVWTCDNCNFSPFLPPKPEADENEKEGN